VNLILNSLDAMPKGGTITISTFSRRGQFVLDFEDTGIGISEANIKRIFEPFFTTKKHLEKRGTGLGLAICYNIINQHKGEIHVSSTVGKGTKFSVLLPLIQEGQNLN
jgi:signal transduction histidine kinase